MMAVSQGAAQNWPVFKIYFTSWLNLNNRYEDNHTPVMGFSNLLAQLFIDPLAPYLFQRYDAMLVCVIGQVLVSSSLLALSQAGHFSQLIFFYGFCVTIGSVMVNSSCLLMAWEWFPDVRG